jgi:hypothetical protein
MPTRLPSTPQNVRYMAYIPQAWVPAFVGGYPPKTALDHANTLIDLMPAPERAQFDYILHFLRALCQKLGGTSAQQDGSKMKTPLASPGRSPAVTSWAIRQMTAFYPALVRGLGATPAAVPGATLDYGAFGPLCRHDRQSYNRGTRIRDLDAAAIGAHQGRLDPPPKANDHKAYGAGRRC